MKNKKGFALLISLALVIGTVLPGTLALSADEASGSGIIEVPAETPAPDAAEAPASEETVALDETPTEEPAQICTCDPAPAEGEAHKEGCPLYTAPKQPAEEEKTCTCDPAPAEGEAHKEGCPLYVAPEQPAEEEKTCTCDPAPAEGEAHKEGCPLYVAPEQPAEEEKTCTCDPAPAEGEAHKEGCPLYAAPELDIAELYSRLMAMQTQEEIVLVLMELSPETIAEFTDEQAAAIEAHYDSLSTTAAVSGDTMTPGDETVVGSSEVRYLTYDFTDAAPFKDPVEGGN